MNNYAIKTRVTTHKPPRIYASFIGETIPLVYDHSKSHWDNHRLGAQQFIDKHLPSGTVQEIVSAKLADDEVVHIAIIKTTNPESMGINTDQ